MPIKIISFSREWRGLLGGDDEQVDSGVDEFFDLRALPERVILGVLEDDAKPGMLVGGVLDVGVHLDPPGLAQVALAHPDRPARGAVAGCLCGATRIFAFAAGQKRY